MEEGGAVIGRLEEAFQDVSLGGRKGTFFLTSKALAFLSCVESTAAKEGEHGEGREEKTESDEQQAKSGQAFELQLLVWIQQWTSTERSKKSAKARLTFSNATVLPSASACVPATGTAVLDFGADRGKMDAACSLLQQLHNAERHRPSFSLHVCETNSPERQAFLEDLKIVLGLPASSDLHAALSLPYLLLRPSLSIYEHRLRSPSLPSPELPHESERPSFAAATTPPKGAGGAPEPAGTPSPGAHDSGAGVHTPGQSQPEGVSESGKKRGAAFGPAGDLRDVSEAKRAKASSASGKEPQKTSRAPQPSSSSATPPALPSLGPSSRSPAPEAPDLRLRRLHLETVEKMERLREAREIRAAQRSLLQKNAVLRNLYLFLVGDPEDDGDVCGDPGSEEQTKASDASGAGVKKGKDGREPGKVLSREEFWKLHQSDLVAHRAQLAPDPPASAFLIRPPQFEYVGGSGGSEKPSLLVDCSEQMLDAILEEDPRINEVYRQLVPTGRIAREKFFERLFQSKYFQEFLGLPAQASAAGHATLAGLSSEDSGTLINLSNTAPSLLAPSAQVVLELATASEDLISTEAFRMRGFGTADGLNSLGGDAVDSTEAKRRMTLAPSEPQDALPGVPNARRPLQSRLLERFNRQSHRLLLQHMLPPTAVAASQREPEASGAPGVGRAAAGELEKIHEQLQLVADQEKKIFSAQKEDARSRPGPAGKAPRPHTRPLAAESSKSERVAAELRLGDLATPETVSHQLLEVSRRQLYAAGSRRVPSVSEKSKSLPACAEWASPGDAGSAEEQERTTRAAERKAVEEWIGQVTERVEGHTVTPTASLYETGRYMFVFNTKLCQSEKVAQVAALDYEPTTVNAVRAHQARVTELLQHFYASAVPDEEKRERIIQALDATKNELERTQESTFGPYTGAATKALCMPLFDQINAAKVHHNKLKKLLSDLRAQRKSHHMRQAALTQRAPSQAHDRRQSASCNT
ncbi:hypothetical protein TGGT1_246520 [Toxoplasma gondii GT1]|uniref:BSD domain-containing protein n=6 Tax=Toxoplasma gondii TaxID=5811 RepID=S7V0S6_TOXGG|nr:hypothetical protein TGGT1_246520 [Toxoplasma gondii GT1]KAF4638469.1 hypothetical protein TGRH88_060770 [Toxoplasma gondii]RQX71950.1 hypothetical protein TGCAST_246520 [Toxoplasma gondii CAST]